jgi:hypothetical protein
MFKQLGNLAGNKIIFLILFSLLNVISVLKINDINSVLIYIFLGFFFCESIYSSFNKDRILLLLIQIIIWFKFYYVPSLILSSLDYYSPYGYLEHTGYITATTYALLSIFALRGAYVLSSGLIKSKYNKFSYGYGLDLLKYRKPNKIYISILLFIFSMVVVYKAGSIGQNFSNRLIQNQGGGFLHIFGYVGYFLAFYFSFDFVNKRKSIFSLSFVKLFLFLLFFGMFFLLLGYRGGFLYPLIFFSIVYLYSNMRSLRSSILLLVLLLLMVFEINWLTGSLRIMITRGEGFTIDNFISSYKSYKEMYLIPMAFNHIDLVAYYIFNFERELLLGTYNTVVPSFFNWIPRFFYPEKELTTGARMAVEIFPGSITSEGRTSSLTTGVIFESLYNYGFIFGLFFIFLFYTLVFSLIRLLSNQGYIQFILSLLLSWNFGFSIFFDDFGGAINKFITLVVTSILLLVISEFSKVFTKNA